MAVIEQDLLQGELTLHGRVMPASNATFVGEIGGRRVVYKPVAGERPLWDFPDGTLAAREEAAYLVSEALGWDLVPLTFRREGPHGPGMVQLWQEPDPVQEAVTLVHGDDVPEGFRYVFEGLDDRDQVVSLVHEDTTELRRMAVFDAVVNNADRKGGHIIPMRDGHVYGVDHGICFSVDPKLRTLLWRWAGKPLPDEAVAVLEKLQADLLGDLGEALHEHLTRREVRRTQQRVAELLRTGRHPEPSGDWPALPWPPF